MSTKRNKKSKVDGYNISGEEEVRKTAKENKEGKKRKKDRENLDDYFDSEIESVAENKISQEQLNDLEEPDSRIVSKKTTKKILHLAKQQKKYDEFDESCDSDFLEINILEKKENDFGKKQKNDFILSEKEVEVDDQLKPDDEGFVFSNYRFEEEEKNFGFFFLNENEKDEQKEESFHFDRTKNLADLVLEKIKQKEECDKLEENDRILQQNKQDHANLLEEARLRKVHNIYKQVGEYLCAYKSGKIPKAFKILPKLTDWESLLYLTNPLKWSPCAMYKATKIFASNLNEKLAQRFFNLVLLPAVRDNIAEHKKLNYHYYQALIFAVFKPAAWFKGILIPLLQQGCTLRECVIFGSIISKASIPVLHSAACIIKLCSIKSWTSPLSYILTILINKKYALPYRVLSTIISYFNQFTLDKRQMPVVWHQTILVFVQRFKYELNDVDRHCLGEVLKAHYHPKITPEIRREMEIGCFLNSCNIASKTNVNADLNNSMICG